MLKNKRTRIGFQFFFDPRWMGGTIYVANSVKILNFLEDKDKPEVFIFYRKEVQSIIDEIEYPYLNKILWDFPSIPKTFVKSVFIRKNLFSESLVKQFKLDALFPMHYFPVKDKSHVKLVAWFADLQYKYYPEFSTKQKIIENDIRVKFILKNANNLVVSSQAVKDDFLKFFKVPKSLKIHIYHFVSIIDSLPNISFKEIKKKYHLPEEYFMVSNQFHKHKNHKVVLEALTLLKNKKKPIYIVMTGSFPNQPDSPYMQELHDIINDNDLNKYISFLGLIPREDQLLLMENAKAIIQPSLFEGWSTVIEDARSLQVPVIASDLPVNIEQIKKEGKFFSPYDYHKLTELMVEQEVRDFNKLIYEPYDKRMKKAAYLFVSILQ